MKQLWFVMLLCFGVLGVYLWNEFYEQWWRGLFLIPLVAWAIWVYDRTESNK